MEYLLVGFAVVSVVCVYVYFVSPRFSPVPYFPSNNKDIPLIVKSLKLRNGQTVYDLGAGDGVVIFAAARHAYDRRFDTKFVAVEINPFLIALMYVRKSVHPNRRNIAVRYGDIFAMKFPLSKNVTFFTYISPWYMERVYRNICRSISSFRFVSYFYALPETVKKKPVKTVRGVNTIFVYNVRV